MVKIAELGLAGVLAFLLGVIAHPLWLAIVETIYYMPWVYWGLGIGFLCAAGGLYFVQRFRLAQYFLGIFGLIWSCLWFLECFPNFTISLL